MKVRDAIEKLKKFDPEKELMIDSGIEEEDYFNIANIIPGTTFFGEEVIVVTAE
jgi:hypothetical protein